MTGSTLRSTDEEEEEEEVEEEEEELIVFAGTAPPAPEPLEAISSVNTSTPKGAWRKTRSVRAPPMRAM